MKLRIGISSCPNDTFAFHALLKEKIELPDCTLEFMVADVEELNQLLRQGELDISKASFHASLFVRETYGVLPVGAALGDGVGPLLVSAAPNKSPGPEDRVLCPGAWTTACLLYRSLFPEAALPSHMLFSEIAPAVIRGEADFGVLIHEGRFTYKDQGLHLVADLGERWQAETNSLIPLGGILARRTLPENVIQQVIEAIRSSIRYGYAHRDEAFTTMQAYAQELSPDAIWPHIELYVNQYTLDLGQRGREALACLSTWAGHAGILPAAHASLEIFPG